MTKEVICPPIERIVPCIGNTLVDDTGTVKEQTPKPKIREKIFTEQVVVKLSKELLTTIDYVVSNYHFNDGKVYRGRSNFIRSACIYMLRSKLSEMGNP